MNRILLTISSAKIGPSLHQRCRCMPIKLFATEKRRNHSTRETEIYRDKRHQCTNYERAPKTNQTKRTSNIIVTIIRAWSAWPTLRLVLHLYLTIYTREMTIPIKYKALYPFICKSLKKNLHFQNTFQLLQFTLFLFDLWFGRLNFRQ